MTENCLQLLGPEVSRVIHQLGWTSFRPIQLSVIPAFFASKDDMVVIAPTASGKTEAVFLPAFSELLSERKTSIQILAISPLRALINDQFTRLQSLANELEIPVHRWHGDVDQKEKARVNKDPRGLLITTPES